METFEYERRVSFGQLLALIPISVPADPISVMWRSLARYVHGARGSALGMDEDRHWEQASPEDATGWTIGAVPMV